MNVQKNENKQMKERTKDNQQANKRKRTNK